jgi:hypothetical protein
MSCRILDADSSCVVYTSNVMQNLGYDITRVYYKRTIYIQDSVWYYSCILHKNYLHPRFCMTLLVYTTQELSASKILHDITRVYYTRTIYIQDSVWHYSCVLHENYLHPRFCMTLLVCTTQELSTSKILYDITRILDADSSCVVYTSNVMQNLGCR